jgi:hypothetical protein
MRVGKLPTYASHNTVPIPDVSSFDFIYKLSTDGLVYGKKSDGTTYLIQGASSNSKIWLGKISQEGTNAPTAIVGLNTLGVNLTFSRQLAGIYTIQATGNPFTVNKTFINQNERFVKPGPIKGGVKVTRGSANVIAIYTTEDNGSGGNPADDCLINCTIKIEVVN